MIRFWTSPKKSLNPFLDYPTAPQKNRTQKINQNIFSKVGIVNRGMIVYMICILRRFAGFFLSRSGQVTCQD